MRRALPVLLLPALLLGGCGGGGDDDDAVAAPPSPKAAPSADPRGDWLAAMSGLCGTLSGATGGAVLQASTSDNQISPAEHAAIAAQVKPATDAFDSGVAALTVPPEAADAKKALDDFLALQATSYAQLQAAADAGDQAALTKAYGVTQGQYASTPEGAALKASGLPEKCSYRGSFAPAPR